MVSAWKEKENKKNGTRERKGEKKEKDGEHAGERREIQINVGGGGKTKVRNKSETG